jgi:hypothetical protein
LRVFGADGPALTTTGQVGPSVQATQRLYDRRRRRNLALALAEALSFQGEVEVDESDQVRRPAVIHTNGWKVYDGLVPGRLPPPPGASLGERVRSGPPAHQRHQVVLGLRQDAAGPQARPPPGQVLRASQGNGLALEPPP